MAILKATCPICGKDVDISKFNEMSEDEVIMSHHETVCPECGSVGIKINFSVEGSQNHIQLQHNVRCICKESRFSDGITTTIYATVKPTATYQNMWYVIVQRETESGMEANIIRLNERGNSKLVQKDLVSSIDFIHAIVCNNVESIMQVKPLSVMTLNFGVMPEQNTSAKKSVWLVACSNRLTRYPVFLTEDKGKFTVSGIYAAEIFETEEDAKKAILQAKEAFGSAYTDYECLEVLSVIARAAVNKRKR